MTKPRRSDRTSMGGGDDAFHTTDWADISRARTLHEGRRRSAVGTLIQRYWKPVYGYLRCKGHSNDEAKDLTQGFFEEVVLGRGLFQQADQIKGRLRTFLLTALDRYVASARRSRSAKKRRPREGLIPLEGPESYNIPEPACQASPEAAFDYIWASQLLEDALGQTRMQCYETGKNVHWRLFKARVVDPIMDDVTPPPLPELCARLGVTDPTKASNMIVTVKRTFQAVLRQQVRRLGGTQTDVDQEIHDLMAVLSKNGARS